MYEEYRELEHILAHLFGNKLIVTGLLLPRSLPSPNDVIQRRSKFLVTKFLVFQGIP